MKQRIWMSPALMLVVSFVCTGAHATTVEQVLATSNSRNIHENLMALGVEAVPELCEALQSHEYSYAIIRALRELADPRAAECLDAFLVHRLAKRAEGNGGDFMLGNAIRVLRDLGDESQVPRMEEIFRNEDISLNTRMHAAATICHFSEGPLRDNAEAFIFDISERFPQMYARRNVESIGVMPEDLLEALWFVATAESERVLIEQLSNPMAIYNDQKAIPYVAQLDSLNAAEALARMAADPRQEPHVRLFAAEGLKRSPRFKESGADLSEILADHEEWSHHLEVFEGYPERLQALLE